ncbi:heterotrimeric G protein alpha subunit [Suillus subalutaceus]|uniref:heterotrimeric G protein alpha subunit n=1 Tax=Suillus subalutaceus TaxID=48586 RepID=UPI001B8783CA|nr:heterotrimeric G protein alpha subunit [Suillus subalutaceus]KAG1859028.1 heterotrimeric G protein alpha subunit [Suillus subalutaceus]
MGNYVSAWYHSDRKDKARSDAIDRQIQEDSRRFRKEYQILLLGASESGKSTIVKQMKITHQNGFTKNELMMFHPTIYRNTLDSAQAIVRQMHNMNVECVTFANWTFAKRIVEYRVESTPDFVFSTDIARAIHELWQDPIIPKVMDCSSQFHLMDSASYFFTEVLRIGTPDYIQTENDVLRAQAKTTGITSMWFNAGLLSIHIIDVGIQLSQRRKWIHYFEHVPSIIFCAALSEYNQELLEGKNQNRMQESLILFESVVNSRWFLDTFIILFLNKIDVFKKKLLKAPIEKYFPEYTGGTDVNKAAKYILWKFLQANRARLSVYPHLMQATDTTDTTLFRLVFDAVKETILQNSFKDSRIL